MMAKPGNSEPWVGEVTCDFVSEWQEGGRFSGREADQEITRGGNLVDTGERIIGVIGVDGRS